MKGMTVLAMVGDGINEQVAEWAENVGGVWLNVNNIEGYKKVDMIIII